MFPSLLFVPAHKERFFAKVDSVHASSIIYDLEDGVPVEHKDAAHTLLRSYGEQVPRAACLMLRIDMRSDETILRSLETGAAIGCDVYVVPKVDCVSDVEPVLIRLARVLGPAHPARVLPIIESLQGCAMTVEMFQTFGAQCAAAGLGFEDLFAFSNIPKLAPGLYDHIRRQFVMDCARFNIPAIDSISCQVRDERAIYRECEYGYRNMFVGKFCVHPLQVNVVNAVYHDATCAAQQWARDVLQQGDDMTTQQYREVDGCMVTPVAFRRAQTIVQQAQEGSKT